MATAPHGENPYHFSFMNICQESDGKNSSESHYRNGSNSFHQRKFRDTYYDEYLKKSAEYYCNLCDREFRDESRLKSHNAEHVTCGRDGCTFTAHSKIVATHVQVQHATGLFSKIKKLKNPEEIKKWLDERRKNYPTKKTVENKAKCNQARQRRGEIIEPDRSGFNKNFPRPRTGLKSRRGKDSRNKKNVKQTRLGNIQTIMNHSKQPSSSEESLPGHIQAFRGIGAVKEHDDIIDPLTNVDFSDEEEIPRSDRATGDKSASPAINNSLGLLMAAYDSDASEDEPPKSESLQSSSAQSNIIRSQNTHSSTPIVAASDDEAPEEIPTVRSTDIPQIADVPAQVHPRKNYLPHPRKRFHQHPGHQAKKRPRKPTLLQTLLSKEIQHERAVIRECINYTVRNNFFGENVESKPEKKIKAKERFTQMKKSTLLSGLLKQEIVHERNIIMQCVRYVVSNNFLDQVHVKLEPTSV